VFEKYTEKARRVVFYARYEVTQLGAATIEPEHLLLGLLREGKALMSRFLPRDTSLDALRQRIEERTTKGENYFTTSDGVPLSSGSKNVLTYAAEESERLKDKQISTGHLLVGLLLEEQSLAHSILVENGVRLNEVRKQRGTS
jgi:ATP-dependent Clp protease ATP-binding subunit ClpC